VEYVREPVPRYPSQSRKQHEQGLVMLCVIIDERGIASQIDVERSSGCARLDQAARDGVLPASFRRVWLSMLMRRGVRCWCSSPIEFSLSRATTGRDAATDE
jgi:periplasmic protein TonB